MENLIFLYDGVCGLCTRSVQFILRHDPAEKFRFAPLQSAFARSVLARHGANTADLDTVYVVLNRDQNESLLERSDAIIFVLRELGSFWRITGWLLRCLPRGLRDCLYSWIARNRYRVFGRYETCPVPKEGDKARFLDV